MYGTHSSNMQTLAHRHTHTHTHTQTHRTCKLHKPKKCTKIALFKQATEPQSRNLYKSECHCTRVHQQRRTKHSQFSNDRTAHFLSNCISLMDYRHAISVHASFLFSSVCIASGDNSHQSLSAVLLFFCTCIPMHSSTSL